MMPHCVLPHAHAEQRQAAVYERARSVAGRPAPWDTAEGRVALPLRLREGHMTAFICGHEKRLLPATWADDNSLGSIGVRPVTPDEDQP
jgi:hypothetical protein